MYVNGKTTPVETISGIGEGEIKDKDGVDEFNYDISDML
jgi:hypothetical protein